MQRLFFTFIYSTFFYFSLSAQSNVLIDFNKTLSDVLIYDKFSPPVASRIFAYSNLSSRVVASAFGKIPNPKIGFKVTSFEKKDYPDGFVQLCMIKTAGMVAKEMLYSQAKWEEANTALINKFITSQNISKDASFSADSIAKIKAQEVLFWASKDGYSQRLTLKKYEVLYDNESSWKPTTPSYGLPVEPHWGTIRPFFVYDTLSISVSIPEDFVPFSTEKKSAFFKSVFKVYKESKRLTKSKKLIAAHWDCNPIQVKDLGHVSLYNFRLTPAAHWVLMVEDAVKNKNWNTFQIAQFYSDLTMAMADAFIFCWETKYNVNLIRPETYINKYIAKGWKPFIETPLFPEYPSGHSMVSATAATICNYYLGDDVKILDDTQLAFGLPTRKYKNFSEAATEAGMSRFYGGIHYLHSVRFGLKKGYLVGNYILNKIK